MIMNQIVQLRNKLIIIFVVFALIVLCMFAIYNYVIIEKSAYQNLNHTTKAVKDSEILHKIDEVHQFYEEKGYHIFEGIDKDNQAVYLFVPVESKKKSKEWKTVYQDDINSQEKIESNWKKECKQCDLHYITPAMIEENALWEIVYTDQSNYVMEYVQMKDGEHYERIVLKQNE